MNEIFSDRVIHLSLFIPFRNNEPICCVCVWGGGDIEDLQWHANYFSYYTVARRALSIKINTLNALPQPAAILTNKHWY